MKASFNGQAGQVNEDHNRPRAFCSSHAPHASRGLSSPVPGEAYAGVLNNRTVILAFATTAALMYSRFPPSILDVLCCAPAPYRTRRTARRCQVSVESITMEGVA